MAVYTLQLKNAKTVPNGNINLTFDFNGSLQVMTFIDKPQMIDWANQQLIEPSLDDMVAFAIRKAVEANPALNNLNAFLNKTLTITVTTTVT